jgi:two-component system response regulator
MLDDRTILLVEDNPDDVDLTQRAVAQSKICNPVSVARDGAEAVDMLLGDDPVNPAVVLLDLQLPKLSGLEVLRRLRAHDRTRHTPVVVLTTSKHEEDLIQSYELGANSYVQKPVDFEEFTTAAAQLGLYWLLVNEAPPNGD